MTATDVKEKAIIKNAKEAVISQLPWGDAGVDVTHEKTVDGILKKAGLDWDITRCPLKVELPDKKLVEVKNKFAHVRPTDNKVITISSDDWRSPKNSDIVAFMKEFANSSGTTLESVGSLRDGSIVWGLIRLKKHFEVGKGDRVNGYTLMTVPHKVGTSISLQTLMLRLWCRNGMCSADQGELHYRQNHMTEFNFDEARKRVLVAHESMANGERNAKKLARFKINLDDSIRKVLVPVFTPEIAEDKAAMKAVTYSDHMPKRIAQIVDSINNAPGATPGTGWGVLNGVTHFADHKLGHNARTRMFRSWLGDMSRKKLEVERVLLQLAS